MGGNITNEESRGIELLQRARRAWDKMGTFRAERERNKRFTFGDQWGDSIETDMGKVRESTYMRAQGNMPLKNNLIRRLVRNVLGVFRNQWENPCCQARDSSEIMKAEVMQQLLDYNMELNRMEEVYARSMEEFLISGLVVHRKWFGRRGGKSDCWTDPVGAENFFLDSTSQDFLNRDIFIVGELHDIPFSDLAASFSKDPDDYIRLRSLYPDGAGGAESTREFGTQPYPNHSFYHSSSPGLCRVVELWTKEGKGRYLCHDRLTGEYFRVSTEHRKALVEEVNRKRLMSSDSHISGSLIDIRWIIDEEWHYHYLTPDGKILKEGISPYFHGEHPYVIKAYPFIDGEIHSFVSDIIDQQKYTNRLISMYDWVVRASAKGVLLFPEGALPDGLDMSDIAEEWSRFNGVIVYRPRTGVPLPQQVSSNSSNAGIADLLNIQLRMMEDISGVNGALQGKLDNGSISGKLYDQQTRNSLIALADLLKTYNDFIRDSSARDVANIMQFYSEARIRALTGKRNPLTITDNFFDSSLDFRISLGAGNS